VRKEQGAAVSRRDPPQLHDSLTPVEVDGETVWYSADGRWVVVSRRTMARWTEGRSDSSAGRRERPAPVDMGPELGGVLMRLSPGAAEAGDDTTEEVVPTVVVVDPKKVELVRAEPSAPSLVSRPSVPKAPVVAPPASPWRAVTLALVALSGLLLFLAAGIKIGTELARRNAAVAVAVTPPEPQEAHTTIEARPAPGPVPTAVEPVPAEPRPVEPPTVEPSPAVGRTGDPQAGGAASDRHPRASRSRRRAQARLAASRRRRLEVGRGLTGGGGRALPRGPRRSAGPS
jgi:hypothetical protein